MKTFEEFVSEAAGNLQEEFAMAEKELQVWANVDGVQGTASLRDFPPLGIESIWDEYREENGFEAFQICTYIEEHPDECRDIYDDMYMDWLDNIDRRN